LKWNYRIIQEEISLCGSGEAEKGADSARLCQTLALFRLARLPYPTQTFELAVIVPLEADDNKQTAHMPNAQAILRWDVLKMHLL
jgi:hypothetical protein